MTVHDSKLRISYGLSAAVAILMAVVSAGGVFFPGLYQDNALVTNAFRGQDMVTLFVAVPLLVAGLVLEMRGSLRGRLVWLAMLAYALYGYAFYMFGAAFNAFFLLYVALFGTSLYALILAMQRVDVEAIGSRFGGVLPARFAIFYMLVTAVGLGTLWTAMSLGFVFTGQVPAPITATAHPTGVVFALDLSVIVPAMALGAALLMRRRAWGWLLAAVLSVKGAVYTLSLTVSTIVAERAGVASGAELPVWVGLTVLGAISTALLLGRALGGPSSAALRGVSATAG